MSSVLVAGSGYVIPVAVRSLLSQNSISAEYIDSRELTVEKVGSRRNTELLLIAKLKMRLDDEELTHKLCAVFPLLPVMVVSLNMEEDQMIRLVRGGVKGLITEDAEYPLIPRAIAALKDGELWCPRNLFNIVLQSFKGGDNHAPENLSYRTILSKRERQIIAEMAQGKTNKEIAGFLGISYSTVVNHSNNIYRKLDVTNRTAAVRVATEMKLIEL